RSIELLGSELRSSPRPASPSAGWAEQPSSGGSRAMDFIDAICTRLCPTLSRAEAEDLLAGTQLLSVGPGEVLRKVGQKADGLYFLFEGSVVVERERGDGTPTRLAELEAPTLLGEVSLVVGGTVTATVRARTDCRLRILTRPDFEERLVQ